jgi:hypothetical protein
LNVLEALRGLMQATAEGERMKLLGPDFRERQAASAQKLAESRARMSREEREEARQGRLDQRQSLQDENAFATEMVKLRALVDRPEEALPPGVAGPAQLLDVPPIEFTSPTGARTPFNAPFRDDLAIRARGEDDLASARRIAEKMQLMTAENALPLGAGRREEIGLVGENQRRAAAISASAANARRSTMTPQQTFRNTLDLSKQYTANTKAARLVDTQYGVMETALANYNRNPTIEGLAPTTETVITTFNKIMDPGSVVRESEYARSTRGQSLLRDIEGRAKALARGGPGLTPQTLAEYVSLARVFRDEYQQSAEAEKQRITSFAESAGLDPNMIVGGAGASPTQAPATHRYNPATGRIEAVR